MKKILISLILIILILCRQVSAYAQTVRAEDISKEFEYISSVISKGISDGDMEKLTQAHRTMSNLELAVASLEKPEDRILFSLAAAYNYVDLCPTAIVLSLSSTTNPTGFTFDCVDRADALFNKGRAYAEESKNLSKATMADISFLIGVGYDRLKATLSSLNVDTKRFHDLELSFFSKAAELGPGFDGVKGIVKKLSDNKYRTKPVIDDAQYNDLHRLLYLDRALPQPALGASSGEFATSTVSSPRASDENYFIDYQWRFSVKKPNNDWQFTIRKASNSMYLTIRKKDLTALEGSGLNIVCRAITEAESQSPPDKLIEHSIRLLKEAGYEIKSQKQISHNGLPAQEIISIHQYQELIQKTPPAAGEKKPDSAPKLVSKQYMIIAVSNGIEYIISFNSLEEEYARIFPEYRMIANTVNMF